MAWKSFDVVRFDLGPLLQGQTTMAKLKVLITCLLWVLEVWNMKPTYRRSWAGNLLMFSDLTLGPSFKVKRWFTGFGELSFRWIQICVGSPMRRSSFDGNYFSSLQRLQPLRGHGYRNFYCTKPAFIFLFYLLISLCLECF